MFALVALYNFVIIPMNAKATITRWENKMLEGDFDTVAMLDQYTEHLMGEFSVFCENFLHRRPAMLLNQSAKLKKVRR